MSAKVIPFYNPAHKNAKPKGSAKSAWKPVKITKGFCLMSMTGADTLCTLIGNDPLYFQDETDEECSLTSIINSVLNKLEKYEEEMFHEDPTYSCFDDDYYSDDYLGDDECDIRTPTARRVVERDSNVIHVCFPYSRSPFTR